MPAKSKDEGFFLQYVTITYRSVLLVCLFVILVAGAIGYFIFPQQTKALLSQVAAQLGSSTSRVLTKEVGQQQAHFTNIDGTVRVKRNSSSVWQNASYDLPLNKGDVIQTGPEGIAKVVFTDGSNYTIKQDSLIVVEDNSTNEAQQTQVAVQVTTGTIDLATATYSQGSSSRVIVRAVRVNPVGL